jgi:manganese transport protein
MDPGNWATDLAGGSRFGYSLLCIILISNLIAILLQALSAKLGIATGRDLAQACRDHFYPVVSFILWILCEIAICACDLAEIIGSAIALKLLFNLPLLFGVCITAVDILILMYFQKLSFRAIEGIVIAFMAVITGCFWLEIWFSKPDIGEIFAGLIPSMDILKNHEMLYISIGILGATVMPHNLYLHSSIVQTRKYADDEKSKRSALKFVCIDSTVALSIAFFVNAAILILAAAVFHKSGNTQIAEIEPVLYLLWLCWHRVKIRP